LADPAGSGLSNAVASGQNLSRRFPPRFPQDCIMPVSIYSVTVPLLTRQLNSLLAILAKAEAYAAERKFDVNVFVNDRLAPDMHPLKFQIQSATDHAKFTVARLSGQTPPSWPDEESTFEELKARIGKALDYLKGFTEADLAGGDEREVTVRIGGEPRTISGETYFLNRALPNFYFHVTTAYDILRKSGVPIGKGDFLA
jgi:hypothetical protein